MRKGDMVEVYGIPAVFRIRYLMRHEALLEGVDDLGKTIANMDTRGSIMVRRSQLTVITNPNQETLL